MNWKHALYITVDFQKDLSYNLLYLGKNVLQRAKQHPVLYPQQIKLTMKTLSKMTLSLKY
jgi:hypothetical protein